MVAEKPSREPTAAIGVPVVVREQLHLGEITLYQKADGRARAERRFAEETLWLSQALMAELLQKDVRTINEHLRNILAEGETHP